jgi:hypothetical protein
MDETPQVKTIQLEKREPTVSKSFRVTVDEAKRIEEVAKSQGVSESSVIRNGLKAIGIVTQIRV